MLGSKSPGLPVVGPGPGLGCLAGGCLTRTSLVSAGAVCNRARAARAVTPDRVQRARRKLQDIGCIPLTETEVGTERRSGAECWIVPQPGAAWQGQIPPVA